MILEYTDPHPSGGIQLTRMTRQQAIDWTKELHPDLTEEQALEDFIVVQWAYWVEEMEGQANYLRDYLNKLESVAEKYKTSCMNWAKESHQKGNRENKEFWEKKAKSIAKLLDQSDKKSESG